MTLETIFSVIKNFSLTLAFVQAGHKQNYDQHIKVPKRKHEIVKKYRGREIKKYKH